MEKGYVMLYEMLSAKLACCQTFIECPDSRRGVEKKIQGGRNIFYDGDHLVQHPLSLFFLPPYIYIKTELNVYM